MATGPTHLSRCDRFDKVDVVSDLGMVYKLKADL